MKLLTLSADFAVCKLKSTDGVDFSGELVSLTKTDEEISLVCESDRVPAGAIAAETGWRALKIDGVLDFGMVGVIAKITALLAGVGVSVFVISTYNTDYILIKTANYEKVAQILRNNGYDVTR